MSLGHAELRMGLLKHSMLGIVKLSGLLLWIHLMVLLALVRMLWHELERLLNARLRSLAIVALKVLRLLRVVKLGRSTDISTAAKATCTHEGSAFVLLILPWLLW